MKCSGWLGGSNVRYGSSIARAISPNARLLCAHKAAAPTVRHRGSYGPIATFRGAEQQPAGVNALGFLGPRHRPCGALHAERQNPVQQVAVFDAVVLGGGGEFLAFGDLGVGIGLEEIRHAVG